MTSEEQRHIDQLLDSIKDRNLDEDIGLGLTRRKLLNVPLPKLKKEFGDDVIKTIQIILKN